MAGTTLNYTQIYTTDQAAEVLQINIQTLRKYIREGKIQASKLGAKEYRITGEDIKSFLDATKTNIKEEIKKMKEIKISENAVLTTEHPASHYNIPVLVMSNGRAYGPSDRPYAEKFNSVFGDMRAAHSVYSYAINSDLDAETHDFIKLYLGQWPEGPQID